MIKWINFLHFYQPPYQSTDILSRVVQECYLPLIHLLEEYPHTKMTFNISGSLIEQLYQTNHTEVINGFLKLVSSGQIELTASAKYHPILPLLPEKEIRRQIEINENMLKNAFGRKYRPKGFYLPEMAYSKKVAKIIKKLGFQWIILDEISYNGTLNGVDPQKRYTIKKLGLAVVFRNREFSKSFVPETILSLSKKTAPPPIVITATDGEMYGHHHKHGENVLRESLSSPHIKTLTISQLLKQLPQYSVVIEPVPSSWESKPEELKNHLPYALWNDPKNRIHQLLWKLRKLAIRIINRNTHSPNYEWARKHLDRGLASCAWWWASEKKPDVFTPITWNPDEIEKGIKELISSIRTLTNISKETKLKAEKIYQQLIKEIWSRHWKKYHPSIHEQTEKQLGPLYYLINKNALKKFFNTLLKRSLPKNTKISDIEISSFKHHVSKNHFYHIVNRYTLSLTSNRQGKKRKTITIICNANSAEPRRGAFEALCFLWKHGFDRGKYRSPQPLYYHKKLKAMFYFEMPGKINLYELVTQKRADIQTIKNHIILAVGWLKKLHLLPTEGAKNFNPLQSRIETIIPGPNHFLKKIEQKHPDYPQYRKKIENLFNIISKLDNQNLQVIQKTIIHGDFHPENIIIAPYGSNSIGVIDYTDTCLGDNVRDVSNFIQQFDWMTREYLSQRNRETIKRLFLRSYFKTTHLSREIHHRLLLYQAWTALRSAIFFLTIKDFDLKRANLLIHETKQYLKQLPASLP